MFKSTLKTVLPAALLFAGASAFAQNEVTLANGTQTTWADVVEYFNNKPSAEDLAKAVADAQTKVDTTSQKIKVTDPAYLSTVQKAKTFYDAFNKWASLGGTSNPAEPTIWYSAAANKITKKNTLNIAYSEIEGLTNVTISEFYEKALDTDVNGVLKIDVVNVYLSESDFAEVTTYDPAAENAQAMIPGTVYNFLNSDETKAQYQTEAHNPAYDEAVKALADAKAAQLANANGYYDHLELEADVTVPAGSTLMNFTGTINANNHVFTLTSGNLFGTLNGTIENAAVNGNFVRTFGEKAVVNNVAVWTGKAGTLYESKDKTTDYTSLAELAYKDRDNYGVANGKLASVTDANKVYNVTIYSTATATPIYVTAADGKYTNLANNQVITPAANVFVKSEDEDLEGTNVYYDGTAKEVVITDGVNFYCPEDIVAKSLEYTREFSVGHATACLPFAINSANIDAQISTYNATADVENAFNFTYQDNGAEAYEPVLLTVKTAGKLTFSDDVTIEKTKDQTFTGAAGAYGLMKKTVFSDIAKDGSTVWGLSGNQFMKGATGVQFPAFRMVVVTAAAASGAPRRIIISDEFGNEIDQSGVANVATDAALEVVGGVGELTINASADLGTVAVYSIDGRVAANVDVLAGTTNVNLAKGVYIVMGKKVLVK